MSGSKTCIHTSFTLNNYPENILQILKELFDTGKYQYIIAGYEFSSTGTPHIQGYLQFKKYARFAKLAKQLKGHFEAAKGSAQDNFEYCTATGKHADKNTDGKPNQFFTWGEMKTIEGIAVRVKNGQIVKEKWIAAREAAKLGKMDEIPAELYIKYTKNFEYIRTQNQPRPTELDGDLKNIWFYGPPGAGKSKMSRMFGPYFPKMINKWWDGYKDEEIIVVDDVGISSDNRDPTTYLLKIWTDRYAFNAEIKGSSKMIRPKMFIINSNYTIDQVFGKQDMSQNQAIHRRFTEVKVNFQGYQPDAYQQEVNNIKIALGL